MKLKLGLEVEYSAEGSPPSDLIFHVEKVKVEETGEVYEYDDPSPTWESLEESLYGLMHQDYMEGLAAAAELRVEADMETRAEAKRS